MAVKRRFLLTAALLFSVITLRAEADLAQFLPAKADIVFGMRAEQLLQSPLFSAAQGLLSFLSSKFLKADPVAALNTLKADDVLGIIIREEWATLIHFGNSAGVEPFLAQNESLFTKFKSPGGREIRLFSDNDTCFFLVSKDTLMLCSKNMIPYLEGRLQPTGHPVRETVKHFTQGKNLPLWLAIPDVRVYSIDAREAFVSYNWDKAGYHLNAEVGCKDSKKAAQNAMMLPMIVQLAVATLFCNDQKLMQDVCATIKAGPRNRFAVIRMDFDQALIQRITAYTIKFLSEEVKDPALEF